MSQRSSRPRRRPGSSWCRRSSRSATATGILRTTPTWLKVCRSSTSRFSSKAGQNLATGKAARRRPGAFHAATAASMLCSTPNRLPSSATVGSKRREATSSWASRTRTTPGAGTFADRSVVHQGRVSCRLEPGSTAKGHTSPNLRLVQRVAVRPHTAYRFSCWVKTRDLAPTGPFHLLGARHQPGESFAHVSRRRPGADRGLEENRCGLQQPGRARGRSLRGLLG